MIYLDSSALVKLVVDEAESTALRTYLRDRRGTERVTSAVARVEVVRAVRSRGATALGRASEVLRRTDSIPMSADLLDEAAGLSGTILRSLDAIHLASALRLGDELVALVAYDRRLLELATGLGLATATPA